MLLSKVASDCINDKFSIFDNSKGLISIKHIFENINI